MTIRSGGRARERSQARPADPGTYDDAWQPAYAPETVERRSRGGRNGGGYNGGGYDWDRRPRRGIPGIIKFLLFALVLGGIVIVVLLTALRPIVRDTVVRWAGDNPAALGIGFVKDMVEEDLGDKLTTAAAADTTQVPFVVNQGETATSIAARLEQNGFLTDRRSFIFIATERGLTNQLNAGTFILRRSMTPDQVVTALLSPEQIHYIDISLRTGLRLEQITAKLETIDGLTMDPADFYELAKHPTAKLLDDYPWLKEILPDGASLEGFLWPATYRVLPDTTAEELIRDMLDGFHDAVGDKLDVPEARGRSFYEILVLASMVEREAVVDDERPLIAGVFENRLHKLKGIAPVLASDPTVFYAVDTLALDELDLPQWKTYAFWNVPKTPLRDIQLPPELLGYQTYTQAGLPPGPICTPTVASIVAALVPDTKAGYLFFLAKKDGSNTHAFAKTAKEHEQNRKKYGYT
jgi:UPF0755 protein